MISLDNNVKLSTEYSWRLKVLLSIKGGERGKPYTLLSIKQEDKK